MKRIHWLLIILLFTTTWLVFTIITFDPTCHLPPVDNTTENMVRPI
jgi:hypothetical protein